MKLLKIRLALGIVSLLELCCFLPNAKGATPPPIAKGVITPVVDINQKNANDKRENRAITLPNHLSALLISDPTFNKSAAAMDVAVGSLEDPNDHLGLAHFLEHMLFLGTKPFPDPEEYNRYLHAYQGSSNAYTAGENTNFHFEVNHDGIEGALKRFAAFFHSSLFTAEYVQREREAVHSEHQKNLNDDFWRMRMVMRALHKKGHPRQKFSTGDRETLKTTTRDVLVNFYEKYYSANIMKLVVMSNKSLDELEKMVREDFSSIPNKNRGQLTYSPEIFDPADLPRLVQIKPIKELKRLSLQFAAPDDDKYWQSKPGSLISHFIGHEGQGSLLSELKRQNFATGLSAWIESSSYTGVFQFDVTLTDLGASNVNKVIGLFFSYIHMLRKEGLKRWIYDERKIMADVDYVYRDLKEGVQVASAYAAKMQDTPPLELDKREYLYYKYEPKDFDYFLSFITPERLNAVLTIPNAQTDQKEQYYGTEFGIMKFPRAVVDQWNKNPVLAELTLPPVNEFIPKKLEILSSETATKPYLLIENEWGNFWFQKDDTFKLPKANLQLLLIDKAPNVNPTQKALSLLYLMSLNEGLNEWKYNIGLAGLDYSISRVERGIQIDVSGYSENLTNLLKSVTEKLKTITIDENRFETLKTDLKRSIANTKLDAAYQQLLYEMKYLSTRDVIHKDELYRVGTPGVDLISGITLEDVKKYATTQLYQTIALEGVAYGSLDPDTLKAALDSLPATLGAKALPKNERPTNDTLQFKIGSPMARVMRIGQINNNCWGYSLQFGKRDPRLNAAMRVGHAHLKTSFFNQLRTQQQLGYLVHSGLNNFEKVLGLIFLIQSPDYSPFEIGRRVREWKKGAITELSSLKPEEFEEYKHAVASEMREKDKTMGERMQTLLFEAIMMEGMFDYKAKIADATAGLTQQEVVDLFQKAFDDKTSASLTIYLMKGDVKDESPAEMVISDDKNFKQTNPVF